MYLTQERKSFLRRCTVEQALNQFHVIDIVSNMERMDRDDALEHRILIDIDDELTEESKPTNDDWKQLDKDNEREARRNGE